MHIASKVFLGIGAVMLLIGGIMAAMGGGSLDDFGDWSVEDKSDWSGSAGSTTYFFPGEEMMVMVRDDVRCDTFSLTMMNGTGENNYRNDDCDFEDESRPSGHEDDPDGWYHMGTISAWDYSSGEYTIEANADFELVPMWEVFGEEIGEAAGGILGILGGIGLAGCGVCSLLLGGILALTLKDKKPDTVMFTDQPLGQDTANQ